jgi:adenine-specific DNA methylase
VNHDPFTLDLFGSSALSSGLGLGVTAFGGYDPVAANDDDPDPTPPSPSPVYASIPARRTNRARANFYLDDGDRGLAATWKERARMNVAAILTANEIERNDVPVTREHQARLIRFTGFGASDLANGMFRRPGEDEFRDGWEELGSSLEAAVGEAD